MRAIPQILILLFPLSCPIIAADQADEKAEISRVINDSIEWFKTKNFDRLFEIFPEDPNLFLFNPVSTNTTIGGKAFREEASIWRDPANFYLSHEIRDLRVNISESGTVAWWSANLDDCGSYNGQKACWLDCRWTGVVEKREGHWVITQCHFSFGADKVAEKIKAQETLPEEQFSDYMSLRKRVVELFTEKKYTPAASLLKQSLTQFPERAHANLFNLAHCAMMLQDYEKSIYWLEEAHRRSIFFGIWDFEDELWQPLSGFPRFNDFKKENSKKIQEAQSQASMKLELVKPTTYNPEQAFPLFIALHGGGENIEGFKPHWTSQKLQQEYIVAYVQSSQVATMQGFHWQDDEVSQKDLSKAYDQIRELANVDPNRVIIGGFSSGGYGSLRAVMSNVVPASGFVVLCPVPPEVPDQPTLLSLKKRGVKGSLLTGRIDPRLEQQKSFVKALNDQQVPVKLVVIPSMGHWYPENLGSLIDNALDDISNQDRIVP